MGSYKGEMTTSLRNKIIHPQTHTLFKIRPNICFIESDGKERFPESRHKKVALQELDFNEEFDGAICIDAMEHIFPKDWQFIL